MDYHTITRKIQLNIIGDKKQRDTNLSLLRDISFTNFKAINLVLSTLYSKENLVENIVKGKLTPTEYNKVSKEELNKLYKDANKTASNVISSKSIYTDVVTRFSNLSTAPVPSIIKVGESLYKTSFLDLKKGTRSLPTVKEGYPIPTIKKYLKINKEYEFTWYKKIVFKLFFGRDRSNNKTIVDRVLKGEYNLCDSSIQLKDNKIFLLLVVQVPKKDVYLNKEKTVGVDLGISYSAVAALNSGLNRLIVPNSILKPRLKLQKQRRDLQKALKYVKGGKGRKKKLARLEKIKESERNFVKTLNHKISYDIIKFALDNNAHKIILEDLKRFSENDKNNFVLRNWSYFELQSFIQYKAEKWGIIVENVSPSYTSQVCNSCGCKGKRVTQAEFVCKNKKCELYDKKINADFNAAKNISKGELKLTYNKETKEFFENLDYGQVVLPKVEGISTQQVSLNIESQVLTESMM